jgi:hypothetical protein
MSPYQGKEIRVNRYVGVSLAKLSLGSRPLPGVQIFFALLL